MCDFSGSTKDFDKTDLMENAALPHQTWCTSNGWQSKGSYSQGLPPLASHTLRHIYIPSFCPGSTKAFSLRILWLQDYLHVCADPPDLLQVPCNGRAGSGGAGGTKYG